MSGEEYPPGPPMFYDSCNGENHQCYENEIPCGCRCENCVDYTEPKCDVCNQLYDLFGTRRGLEWVQNCGCNDEEA